MKILFPYMARWYAVNWTRYHSLLSALALDGYEVHVIQPPSLKSNETNYQEIEPRKIKGIHIHDVPLNKTIWNFKFPFDKLFKKAYFSLASYKFSKELNKREKFDILLVYNIPQLPYLSLSGPTKVFDYADDYVDMLKYELGKLDSPVTRALAKSMLNKMFMKSSLIMSVSHELARGLSGNVKVIPNGVSLDKARLSLETEVLEINSRGKPVVGFVGSFEYFIDLDLILDVAVKMPNLHFLMVGSGRDMGHVKERIKNEGIINIQLTGGVPHEHIFGYINKMDICLNIFKKLPVSHRACPIKLFEYLSQKKPVISTHLHELKYIDEEFIYYADTTEQAVEQIHTILNDNGESKEKALRGYEITKKKYTWEAIAKQTSLLFEEARFRDVQTDKLKQNNN